MSYEDDLNEVGGFGSFQKWLCFYLVLSSIPNGYLVLCIIFTGYKPDHRCRIPDLIDNNQNASSLFAKPATELEECFELNYNVSNNATQNATAPCTNGWVYDIEPGRTTFVTEFNLVCNQSATRPFITSVLMLGVLIGSGLSGFFADRYGRRPVFLVGTLFMFVFFGLCGLAPSVTVLSGFVFFAGGFNLVNYATAFVLASEATQTSSRVFTGVLTIGGFALGYMLIPLIAYLIPNWRHLYLASAATGILFIPFYWVIPESPRWLYVQGKSEQYTALMTKIAKANGTSFTNKQQLLEKEEDEFGSSTTTALKESVKFIKHRLCRFRFFNMCFTWFSNAVIYYGLSLNTSNLGGNAYFNCFVGAFVEIPAYVLVIATLNKMGRKTTVIATVLVSGVTCGLVPFINEVSTTASIVCAMFGKFAISACFVVIYIYGSEIFPTVARNSAVGLLSMCARSGSMVAPYLNYAGEEIYYLPYLTMFILASVSAVLTLFLPETNNKPMPENLEDMPPYRFHLCGKSTLSHSNSNGEHKNVATNNKENVVVYCTDEEKHEDVMIRK
uniref:Solute carrier family 22 member 4-like n=1 Tax=Phallusia mammillata TaxID=59560 RepID=A0A6F9DT12_9ASCI|nr:solute carrier family 22 member 4-like [Phallusia mammillata]